MCLTKHKSCLDKISVNEIKSRLRTFLITLLELAISRTGSQRDGTRKGKLIGPSFGSWDQSEFSASHSLLSAQVFCQFPCERWVEGGSQGILLEERSKHTPTASAPLFCEQESTMACTAVKAARASSREPSGKTSSTPAGTTRTAS